MFIFDGTFQGFKDPVYRKRREEFSLIANNYKQYGKNENLGFFFLMQLIYFNIFVFHLR